MNESVNKECMNECFIVKHILHCNFRFALFVLFCNLDVVE